MTGFIELNSDAFGALFKPIPNPIEDNASFDFGTGHGTMFETYGNELELVKSYHQRNPRMIWTLCSGDNGDFIQSGFHFVNRLGYFITENPAPQDVEIQVTIGNDAGREIAEKSADLLSRVEAVVGDYDFCAGHSENDIEYTLHRIRGEVMMAGRIYEEGGEIEESSDTLSHLLEIEAELSKYEEQRAVANDVGEA